MGNTFSQLQGIWDGYVASGHQCYPVLTFDDILIINAQADLGEIENAVCSFPLTSCCCCTVAFCLPSAGIRMLDCCSSVETGNRMS